jgi:hypothetical protein
VGLLFIIIFTVRKTKILFLGIRAGMRTLKVQNQNYIFSAFKRLGARHVSANKNPKGFLFLKPLPPKKRGGCGLALPGA